MSGMSKLYPTSDTNKDNEGQSTKKRGPGMCSHLPCACHGCQGQQRFGPARDKARDKTLLMSSSKGTKKSVQLELKERGKKLATGQRHAWREEC